MKKRIICNIVIILFAMYPAILLAENSENNPKLKTEGWILTLSLGANFEGPSKAIKNVMTASGFGADEPGGESLFGWISGEVYPKTSPFIGGILGLHYVLKSPFAIGIITSYSQGKTKGRHYNETWPTTRKTEIYFDVNYSILMFAPLISVQASWFKLGLGGALYYLSTYNQKDTCWKVGFVLNSGLIIPFKDQPYYGELIFQYRSMGGHEIGPYIASEGAYSASFPESHVNYSHIFLGIGVGIRL